MSTRRIFNILVQPHRLPLIVLAGLLGLMPAVGSAQGHPGAPLMVRQLNETSYALVAWDGIEFRSLDRRAPRLNLGVQDVPMEVQGGQPMHEYGIGLRIHYQF